MGLQLALRSPAAASQPRREPRPSGGVLSRCAANRSPSRAACATLGRMRLAIIPDEQPKLQAEPGGGVLPDAYRPAASADVPAGSACGNCRFYNEDESRDVDGAVEVWCDMWAAFVRGDFYCDSWEAAAEGAGEDEMSVNDSPVGADTFVAGDDNGEALGNKRRRWVLALEGVETGDGRMFDPGAITWRDLPLPFMATDETSAEHMGARLVANLIQIERAGNEIIGITEFIDSDDPAVVNLQRLITNGDLRGVSVDLDQAEGVVEIPAGEVTPGDDGTVELPFGGAANGLVRITAGRIMGATAVPFPAFAEAKQIAAALMAGAMRVDMPAETVMQSFDGIDFAPSAGAREEAARGLEWRREFGRGGTDVGVARARDIAGGRNLSPDTVNRMLSYFARHEVDKDGEGWSPGEPGYPSAGRIAWALWGGDPGWAWARGVKRQMQARERQGSVDVVAAAIAPPVEPPAGWFADPALTGPTRLTVTDDGRVFGHLALWDSCHVGFAAECVRAPRSATNYAAFATGEILTHDGSRVRVGQITTGSGHADLAASPSRAKEHYDHTGWVAADVACGEDRFGIWMAGALRPGLSPERVREFMGADVSGDWRRIGGSLELVGIASVNVPGFPKMNAVQARVASGFVQTLVAAAPEPCEPQRPDQAVADRIALSIGRHPVQRDAHRYQVAVRAGRDYETRRREVAERVRGGR